MSAKTKIVVLHMKELIYTAVFAALGILFIILLIMMFLPGREESPASGSSASSGSSSGREPDAADADSIYIPGVYTTELVLGSQSIDVEVIVDKNSIASIRMVNLNDAITTMYPLLEPTFEAICSQVYELQTLEGVSYAPESKYTSLVLLEAIKSSLNKAERSKKF